MNGAGARAQERTAGCEGYCFGSAMWSLDSLIGRMSSADRNERAKLISVMFATPSSMLLLILVFN